MPLKEKRGLIIGIANNQSVAYGCAEAFARAGASLAVSYLNAKVELYVRPLAEHRLVSIEVIGNLAVFLAGGGAAALTRNIEFIDAGYHVLD